MGKHTSLSLQIQFCDHLDVISMGKHIQGLNAPDLKPLIMEPGKIPRQGGRLTRDIKDLPGAKHSESLHGFPRSSSGGIEHGKID